VLFEEMELSRKGRNAQPAIVAAGVDGPTFHQRARAFRTAIVGSGS